jgi:hypothetical protein
MPWVDWAYGEERCHHLVSINEAARFTVSKDLAEYALVSIHSPASR